MLYESRSGSYPYGFDLSPTVGWHRGPTRPAESLVNGNRQFRWVAGTTNGNFYDMRWFKVTYSYFVLS